MPILKVQLLDASAAPLANTPVQVSGCEELVTNQQGIANFLLSPGDSADILIAGRPSWSGPLSALKPVEVFRQTPGGFVRS